VSDALKVSVPPAAAGPVEVIVWLPAVAFAGIVTGVEKCPSASAVTVARVTGSDVKVSVTAEPGAYPAGQFTVLAVIVWPGETEVLLSARLQPPAGGYA